MFQPTSGNLSFLKPRQPLLVLPSKSSRQPAAFSLALSVLGGAVDLAAALPAVAAGFSGAGFAAAGFAAAGAGFASGSAATARALPRVNVNAARDVATSLFMRGF